MTERLSCPHPDSLPKESGSHPDASHQVSCSHPDSSRSTPLSSPNHPHTPTAFPTDRDARTTSDSAFTTLLLALRELDTSNQLTPCQTPGTDHLWTSDDAEDREAACHRCQPCPLLPECRTHATTAGEKHHVWAGIDHTPTTRKNGNRP